VSFRPHTSAATASRLVTGRRYASETQRPKFSGRKLPHRVVSEHDMVRMRLRVEFSEIPPSALHWTTIDTYRRVGIPVLRIPLMCRSPKGILRQMRNRTLPEKPYPPQGPAFHPKRKVRRSLRLDAPDVGLKKRLHLPATKTQQGGHGPVQLASNCDGSWIPRTAHTLFAHSRPNSYFLRPP